MNNTLREQQFMNYKASIINFDSFITILEIFMKMSEYIILLES